MAKQFRIRLKRSRIGLTKGQKATLDALGMRKINQERTVADNPANRGQIFKMQHFIEVIPEKKS